MEDFSIKLLFQVTKYLVTFLIEIPISFMFLIQ